MERKIGEIFEYNGEWYQCIIGWRCKDCVFNEERKCYTFTNNNAPIGDCSAERRTDKYSVIFKKLEKVGNPYQYMGGFYQKYRLFSPINETINLKIKQNQENMEENKLNLKPFDLEAAKSGKPVCTRDGREARIICFDRNAARYNIVALVECSGFPNKEEEIKVYANNGRYFDTVEESPCDLMMLPEKHEGWVNLYREEDGTIETSMIRDNYDDAKTSISSSRNYITTVKIQWEE